MEVYGKPIAGLGPKEEYQACFVGYIGCYALNCNVFLMHCLISANPMMISAFKKATFLKQKIIKTAEKELY